MCLMDNREYQESLVELRKQFNDFVSLEKKSILLTGATGMLGSFLVDAIMQKNKTLPEDRKCRIIALGRNRKTAAERFPYWMECGEFLFLECDIMKSVPSLPSKPDYVIHAASTTHPVAYATEPIDTIMLNIAGTFNLLQVAAQYHCRFLLLSTVEIYGENRGDTDLFDENYNGYINCNTLRAGYPESKRTGEALCQAYIKQYNVDAVIIRLPRCFGPTMKKTDSKAIAQFIKNGLNNENIVLKSKGNQFFSYAYVSDAILGILNVLVYGKTGEAYNLASDNNNITLKELAELIADIAGVKVVFDLPNEIEAIGYSKATKAVMQAEKIKQIGWSAQYSIEQGVKQCMDILKACPN